MLLLETGWSWEELCVTPDDVVGAVMAELVRRAQAQAQGGHGSAPMVPVRAARRRR